MLIGADSCICPEKHKIVPDIFFLLERNDVFGLNCLLEKSCFQLDVSSTIV